MAGKYMTGTDKACLRLVRVMPEAIFGIENPSEEVQLAAVEADPENIVLIENPTEKVQLEAIAHSRHVYITLTSPTPTAKALHILLWEM